MSRDTEAHVRESRESTRGGEPAAPEPRAPIRICPNCGCALSDRSCKLICPNPACGYFLSCSDYL